MIAPRAIINLASSSGSYSILWEKRYLWMWEGSYHRKAVAGAQTMAHPASSARSAEPTATTIESCWVTPSVLAHVSVIFQTTTVECLGLMQVIAQPILPGCSWPFSQCAEKLSLPCLLLLSS